MVRSRVQRDASYKTVRNLFTNKNRSASEAQRALNALNAPSDPEEKLIIENFKAIYATGAEAGAEAGRSVRAYMKECSKLGLSQTASPCLPARLHPAAGDWAGELLLLCEAHKFRGSNRRLNIAPPDAERVKYGKRGCVYLKKRVPSQTLTKGPIFDAVKKMLPETTAVCLNKNMQCAPHKDSRNTSASHLLFLGEFTGGALVTEKGDRYEARNEWMGPFDFRNTLHWNEPILSGTKISLVAFQSNRF